MIISDLEHLEVVSQEKNIQGGGAYAYANANAYASGKLAATTTGTVTGAFSYYVFYVK
ncbi:MAG: hypothetical protein AB1589_18695 [Cyanobacteriota bacterium]